MAHDNVLNTISHGTEISGTIRTKGDIRIEGKVVGDIVCEAKLVIGENGFVDGTINSRNATVSGKVKGKVFVHEILKLESTAQIDGDMYTQKLSVAVGATFTGNCTMGENAAKEVMEFSQANGADDFDEPTPRRQGKTKTIFNTGGRKSGAQEAVNEKGATKTAV